MTHAAVHSPSSKLPAKSPIHSPPAGLASRLDGERIAASASAITLNAVVLMLMLVPLAAPQLLPKVMDATEIDWVPRDKPRLIEPIPVPVTARPVTPQTITAPARVPVAPPLATATAEPGDIAAAFEATTTTENVAANPVASLAPPQTGAQLQYALAPPPPYPREALREGHRGTVLLQVLVDTDGKPLQVDIARSSGHRALDRAAQRHVLARWTFRPAVDDGRPVQAIGLVPVEFALH